MMKLLSIVRDDVSTSKETRESGKKGTNNKLNDGLFRRFVIILELIVAILFQQ